MQYSQNFLALLDNVKVKRQYIKIIILSFDEKEIREIKGLITGGSISVNGSSAVRRTISLSMTADKETNNLTNIDNLISLNKKIKVEVGFANPLVKYKEQYGDTVWFKCGTYVISSASVNTTATGCNISIQGKDKMAMLDGTAGGTLPASVTFHETYVRDNEGNILVEYPTIYQIIQESVNHFGLEPLENIIINNLDKEIKLLTKYVGDTPIRFISSTNHNNFVISDTAVEGYNKTYTYGDDVGYVMTDFTYPGDLILGAGSTVTTLLDNIVKVLTNYEYFYDVEGNFIFQEKQNYLNNHYTYLIDVDEREGLQPSDYVRVFFESKYVQSFTDSEGVTTYNNNPRYDNVKNDFIVWGQRTSTSGLTTEIRYHLAIDEKPAQFLSAYDMWEIFGGDGLLLRYAYVDSGEMPELNYGETLGKKIGLAQSPQEYEWREELYRQALDIWVTSGDEGYYDDELAAEWRKLYDPSRTDWKEVWNAHKVDEGLGEWHGWNPDVVLNPGNLDYWLDFIDPSSGLGAYSVKSIGRRTKVINSTDIKTIYNKDVPDVIFVENTGDLESLYEIFTKYRTQGQDYCLLQPDQMELFTPSGTLSSCYDKIRELIDQYLIYNTTITITCMPKYYFEPNQLIYVHDNNSGIHGSFVISNFTLPLQYNGTMSITATEAMSRV